MMGCPGQPKIKPYYREMSIFSAGRAVMGGHTGSREGAVIGFDHMTGPHTKVVWMGSTPSCATKR